MSETRTMTLGELIRRLNELPTEYRDYRVWTEGCDCFGEVGSIDVSHDQREVSLLRASEPERPQREYQMSDVEKELRTKGLLP